MSFFTIFTVVKIFFLRQTVLDRNMKNIHRILKKTAECEPYEFYKVNTIALIWQLLSSILIINSEICLNTTF